MADKNTTPGNGAIGGVNGGAGVGQVSVPPQNVTTPAGWPVSVAPGATRAPQVTTYGTLR